MTTNNSPFWPVVLTAAAILMVTMGIRQTTGLYLSPINTTTGLGITVLDPSLEIQSVAAIAVRSDPGQPDDGDIILGGVRKDPAASNPQVLALVRLKADGSLDTTFGEAGVSEKI